jgi:pyruvate carboxylase
VLAAVEAGVDAVDAAMDALSGNTSQPCLGSIVEALQGTRAGHRSRHGWIRKISFYWEAVRNQYAAFESDLKAPASEVYLHEMPGGQFTNLKEQARSLGLEDRWHEVAQAYAEVNQMFGDIVKVTPSSKVVGDMALMMVSQASRVADVENPDKDIAFPESVVSMMRGDLGQPPWRLAGRIQAKVLKGDEAYTERPGSLLPPDADLEAERKEIETGSWSARSPRRSLPPTSCIRRCSPSSRASRRPTVRSACCRRRSISTGSGWKTRSFVEIEKGKTLVMRMPRQSASRTTRAW